MGVKIPAAFEDATGQVTRLTGELEFLVAATPGEALTADNPAATASFQPGGGTAPFKWVRVPIAFNTPNLNGGILLHTFAENEYLMNGWLEVTEVFDGTTPLGDIGFAVPADIPGTWNGAYDDFNAPVDMTIASGVGPWGPSSSSTFDQGSCPTISQMWFAGSQRYLPARAFIDTGPVFVPFGAYVVVSDSGFPTGGPVGGATGQATAVLLIGTP